jgi:hypothetical protein
MFPLLIVLTAPLQSVASEPSERPQSEPHETIDPALELIYLDHIDRLTADIEACEKRLALKEEPPECSSGFPWKTVLVSMALGWATCEMLD